MGSRSSSHHPGKDVWCLGWWAIWSICSNMLFMTELLEEFMAQQVQIPTAVNKWVLIKFAVSKHTRRENVRPHLLRIETGGTWDFLPSQWLHCAFLAFENSYCAVFSKKLFSVKQNPPWNPPPWWPAWLSCCFIGVCWWPVLWWGPPQAPQSHGSKEKKAYTGRFLGKLVLGTHCTSCRGGTQIPQPCFTPSGDTGLLHLQFGLHSGNRVLRVTIWQSKYDV